MLASGSEADAMNTEIRNATHQAGEADPALAAAAFAQSLLSGDCGRLVEDFYTEGARLVPPDRHPIVGRDPIRRHWTGIAEAGLKAADIRISSVERAGSEAIGLGRYALTFESDGRLERSLLRSLPQRTRRVLEGS
jgi:ketosteroid isomerase-like protein